MPTNEDSTPRWDVALAALAVEEYRQKQQPLLLEDFHRLARLHAIRFDDIMETMFQLVINGKWSYRDRDGVPQIFDQQTLEGLYVQRRLSEQDLNAFDGSWRPV